MDCGSESRRVTVWCAACLIALAGLKALAQQAAPANAELEEGLRYVRGLQALMLPQIADLVLAELEAKYPDAKARIEVRKLDGMLAQGKFEEVKKLIAARPNQDSAEVWAMKLALADAHYNYGQHPEAKALYEAFFKRFENPPPELVSFYSEASYKYAQMLLYLKDLRGGLDAYRRVLKVKQEQHIERQCMAEMADVAIRIALETGKADEKERCLKEADGLADKLLWVQDIWFGKAIVLKAHAAMIRGKAEEAKKLVDDYMETLQIIHNALVKDEAETGDPLTRVSPMPECRYLLAAMLQDEANRLIKQPGYDKEAVLAMLVGTRGADGKRQGNGAYQHFINVYLKYPESTWAADAGERAEQVRMIVKDVFGGEITTVITPAQTAKVRAIQYRDARLLYAQGQVENATERLLQVLNRFPDAEEAVPALGDLARCYIQTIPDAPDHELYAEMCVGHLAERYGHRPETRSNAGDELLRLAEKWLESGRPERRAATFDLFFANYPNHPLAASYMASFGERHYQDKDYPVALSYFRQVAETYTNSPLAFDALNRIATIYEECGDLTNHIAAIELYVKRLEAQPAPGQALMSARYRQAQAYKNYGVALLHASTNVTDQAAGNVWLGRAAVAYDGLATTLQQPGHPYQTNAEEKKKNAALLEAALYNTAYCLTQVNQPAARVPDIRKRAVAAFEKLVSSFPKSEFAPVALIQIGSIWTMLRDATQAEAALSRLLKEYPNSNEARSALPMIADNLMKLGMREEAVPRYRQMFADAGGKYSDADMLRAAQVLTDAKEFDLAQQGIERVLGRAKDVNILAPARLRQAELLVAREKYADAVKALEAFVKDYPNLSLVVDANLLLSRAASEVGRRERDDLKRKLAFNASVGAVKAVKARRTNQVEMAEMDIAVGRIMTLKSQAEAEFNMPEKSADSRGQAVISYQAFIDSTDPANLALAPLVETAYAESVPLLLELRNWRMAAENCDTYLQTFPRGRFVAEMRAWQIQAQIELGNKAPEGAKPAAAGAGVAPAVAAPPAK
ncbi:MAG: tetratricopeptide repeat protein [Kiritimatiellae bacterium]|nr:tetratricopeptide repeat protein [Kiritimatiellia bacterium]